MSPIRRPRGCLETVYGYYLRYHCAVYTLPSTSERNKHERHVIHQSIEALVNEEHELWKKGENGGLDTAGRKRLEEIAFSSTVSTIYCTSGRASAMPDPIQPCKIAQRKLSRVTSSSLLKKSG